MGPSACVKLSTRRNARRAGFQSRLAQQRFHEARAYDPQHVGRQHQDYEDAGNDDEGFEYSPHRQITGGVRRALGHSRGDILDR